MPDRTALAQIAIVIAGLAACLMPFAPQRRVVGIARAAAFVTAAPALTAAGLALADPGHPRVGPWLALDAAAALLLVVIAAVGLVAVLASPAYLAATSSTLVAESRRRSTYFLVLFAFWAMLLAVPVAGNLGAAWLLVEATTAASALLVGFSGRPRALEAGWKYLVLTSLGLGVALLGVMLLAVGVPGGGLAALSWRALPLYAGDPRTALLAYVLVLAGLAAKIGWAPVHNWLPDAHSEAPAPVSAMLSAALLPAVVLVAWRCRQGLEPVVGTGAARGVLIGFGLASMAVAVPFVSRALAWKRLLAYSSLEHMGVVALGIGLATPLALAGAAVHIVAHAVAKCLGFVAVTPLLAHEPRAGVQAVTGIARTRPALGATLGLSLGALSGLPPSPLFVSELLVVAGGVQAGLPWVSAVAALLLALAFLGLVRALLDTTAGAAGGRVRERGARRPRLPGLRGVSALAVTSGVVLLGLTGVALWLPGTSIVQALLKGVS